MNNTSNFANCLLSLHSSIVSFEIEDTNKGFSHFKEFCESSVNNERLRTPENRVYRNVWKFMDQPTYEDDPNIAHPDFGRVAFYNQEGRTTTNEIRARAIEALYNRLIKHELKDIYHTLEEEALERSKEKLQTLFILPELMQDRRFKNLKHHFLYTMFMFSNLEIQWKDSEKLHEIRSSFQNQSIAKTDNNLNNIDNQKVSDFSAISLWKDLEKAYANSSKESIKQTINIVIFEMNVGKFSIQGADNYHKRKALQISSNSDHKPQKVPFSQGTELIKQLLIKNKGICFGEASHNDQAIHRFFLNKNLFSLFKEMNVVLFTKELPRTVKDLLSKKYYHDIEVKKIDLERVVKENKKTNNTRVEIFNYQAAKLLNEEIQNLKENEKFIALVGRGHLTNILNTDTSENGSSKTRMVLGLAALLNCPGGCPTVEMRSKANEQNVEEWLNGGPDSTLQEGFENQRIRSNGEIVQFKRAPWRADFELWED